MTKSLDRLDLVGLDDILLPALDHPGWHEWRVPGAFNREVIGTLLVRGEADGVARTRIFPAAHMGNVHGMIHGGIITALADATLFAGPGLLTRQDLGASVTVEQQAHRMHSYSPSSFSRCSGLCSRSLPLGVGLTVCSHGRIEAYCA